MITVSARACRFQLSQHMLLLARLMRVQNIQSTAIGVMLRAVCVILMAMLYMRMM